MQFRTSNALTPIEVTLATNASSGVLRVLGGRDYTATVGITNAGVIELGGGVFDTPMLDNQAGSEFFGFGTITTTLAVASSGTVRAAGGTLTPSAGIQGTNGTLQVDSDGVLDLSLAVSTAGTLIHNGSAADSLNLGANDLVVSVDYNNANFGVGDAFDPRANVGGAGEILADGDVAQRLVGDAVSDGTTAAATLAFGNVHVGDVVDSNYRVHNAGTTGPSLRGVVQPGANITDSQLSGSGVSSVNFGPVATGADSADLTVTYTATTAGDIAAGQTVGVVNNFANIAGQTLIVTGTAYRLANPTAHTPEPVAFGNFHVGDAAPSQALSLANNVPNDGFSEALNASIGSATGGVTTNGGMFNLLLPGATDGASLSVGIDTSTAGLKDGAATISLASDGAGSSELGVTPLAGQTVNVSGSVFRFANPTAMSPNPINFGNFHVGDAALGQALSLSNDVPNDGFSEALNASIGSATGGVTTNGGSFSLLAPGASNSIGLSVGIDTSTAGDQSGTATISLVSDGSGSSGLGQTNLPSQVVNVTGTVYRLANPTAVSPSPINFGSFRVGDPAPSQTLSLSNSTPDDGFSEVLNASIGAATGGVTTNNGFFGELGPGATNNTSLSVGIDTSNAGSKDGTASIALESDGNGSSGLGITALPAQIVNVSGSVLNPAAPSVTPDPIDLGDFHIGQLAQQTVAIANNAPAGAFSESLVAGVTTSGSDVSRTGPASVTVAPGSSNSEVGISVSTATAGAKTGSVNVAQTSTGATGLADLDLGTQKIPVSASVFRFADPTIQNAQPIDFGIVHVGDVVTAEALVVRNSADADGFSEGLDAAFTGSSARVTTAGPGIDNLVAGAINDTGLLVGVDTATAGVISGSAQIAFTSDGAGVNTLGQTALAGQSVTVSATVNNFADAALSKTSGDGVLTEPISDAYVLDLGGVRNGQGDLSAELELTNLIAGPADDLAGSWMLGSSDFGLSGFATFADLAAGDSIDGLIVTLDDTTSGVFTHTITLSPRSTNASGFDGALTPLTVELIGTIFLPGDYDADGSVTRADYDVWTSNFGSTTSLDADGNNDGIVDAADYTVWRDNLGGSLPTFTNSAAVPEPTAMGLLFAGVAITATRQRYAINA